MAIIDPNGLFKGDRLSACSDLAQYLWPRLFLSANGYGRMELTYDKLLDGPLRSLHTPPTEDEISDVLIEYIENALLFVYQAEGGLWGQWDTEDRNLPRHKNAADRRSPAPNPDSYCAWKDAYIDKKATRAAAAFKNLLIPAENAARPKQRQQLTAGEFETLLARFGTWETTSPRALPECAGVYILSLDSQPLYAGKATNIRKRFNHHQIDANRINHQTFDGNPAKVKVHIRELPMDQLDTVEASVISALKPLLNRTLLGKSENSTHNAWNRQNSTLGVGVGVGIGEGIESKTKPSAADAPEPKSPKTPAEKNSEESSLHAQIREAIQQTWLNHNPEVPTCPWGPAEGKQLKSLLGMTPKWPPWQYEQCLKHLFESTGFVVSTSPREFITHLPKYLKGPLNEFKQPRQIAKSAAAERISRIARTTARAAGLPADGFPSGDEGTGRTHSPTLVGRVIDLSDNGSGGGDAPVPVAGEPGGSARSGAWRPARRDPPDTD